MFEILVLLFSGAVVLSMPAALVLALVALSRSRRVVELERRVASLEAGRPSIEVRPAESEPRAKPVGEEPRNVVTAPQAAPATEAAPAPAPVPWALRPVSGEGEAAVEDEWFPEDRTEEQPEEQPAAVAARPEPASEAGWSWPAEEAPVAVAAAVDAKGEDWERFLGVRGAALVGGMVLALAGLLFVQHSIQQGWITPTMRVLLAIGAGIASLALSQPLWTRGYRHAANALSGAGGVLVLGGAWAGYRLYGLLSFTPAFALMAATSVALALLALRRPSKVVAVFGVLGGFATPLLVTLGSDHPLGLFGYLIAIDLGLYVLARRPGWGLLGVLGSLGSMVVFAVWLGLAFDVSVAPWALAFVAGSTAALCLPVLAGRGASERPSSLGAVVALAGGFPLALTVLARADFGPGLLPLAAVAAVLLALALLVARRGSFPALAHGGAAGVLVMLLAWSQSVALDVSSAWQLLGVGLGLCLIAHVPLELQGRPGRWAQVSAALLLEFGLVGLQVLALVRLGAVHPLTVVGWALVPMVLVLRQARLVDHEALAEAGILPAAALALAIARTNGAALTRPLDAWFSVCLVAVPVLFALRAFRLRRAAQRSDGWRAVAQASTFGAFTLWMRAYPLRGEPLELGITLAALLLVAGHAAGRRGSELLMAVPAVAAALLAGHWSRIALPLEGATPLVLAVFAAAPLALVFGPRREAPQVGPWIVVACAPLAWLPTLLKLAFDNAGRPTHVAVALASAALAGVLALRARALPVEHRARRHALAAAAGAASIALALTPALALDRGHFATPWLVGGLLVLAWRALRHDGLVVGAVVALVLLGLPGSLIETSRTLTEEQAWERSGWPVLHWMSVLWIVPALIAGASSRALSRGGALAQRAAGVIAVVALLAGFAWLNLEVQDLFNEGAAFRISTERLALRDFLTSLAWVLYALGLLVAGLRAHGSALRKASLGFLLAAVAKVFLHDLGTLTGLYRVGSLLGLALVLFAVSLLYQRFVFRRPGAGASAQAQH